MLETYVYIRCLCICSLGCGMGQVTRKIRWESLKFTRNMIFLIDHRFPTWLCVAWRLQGGRISWGDRGSEAAFGSWCLALLPAILTFRIWGFWVEELESRNWSFECCFFVSLCFPPFLLWGAGSFFWFVVYIHLEQLDAIGPYTKVTHDATKPLPKLWTTVMNSMLLWKASYWIGGFGLYLLHFQGKRTREGGGSVKGQRVHILWLHMSWMCWYWLSVALECFKFVLGNESCLLRYYTMICSY